MKTIAELQEGERVQIQVLIKEVHKGVTNKQADYLSFVFQDKSGQIDGKYWNVNKEHLDSFNKGNVVMVKGDVLKHKQQLQFKIISINTVDENKINFRELVPSSVYSEEELKSFITTEIEKISNTNIKQLIQKIMELYENNFYTFPAASKNHHSFVGGLATHVVGMLKISNAICSCYPQLNQDYLTAGIILHDLGKVIELSGPIATEYTMEGKLLGHISIMQAEIARIAMQLGIEGEESILLRHMVLSHHGVYEYGSPVLPMIPEAEVLYLIDNLDARMNTMDQLLGSIEVGEFSNRCFALENRSFYKKRT